MKYFKTILKSLAYTFSSIVLLTLFLTIFSYFNILSDGISKTFKLMIPMISSFIGGFIIGKNFKKKGFIEGLKLGVIIDILLLIIGILSKDVKITSSIFYIIIIFSTILGSIIGIQKKVKN